MADEQTARLTLDVGALVRDRLEEIASRRGVDIGTVCLDAFAREIAAYEVTTDSPDPKAGDFDSLFAFCDEVLGGRKLSKTGLEYLDEAREIRAEQMKEW